MGIHKILLFLTVLMLSITCFTNEPVVLQNGINSYNGCVDTYLATANFYEVYAVDNFSDSITMSTWT